MLNRLAGRYGDYKKHTVKIDGQDVSAAIASTVIFHDLFSPTWTCQISLIDTSNLTMKLPIKQGSKINITIETSLNGPGDDEKTFDFIVYKIGNKNLDNHMVLSYTVFGVDEMFIKNQETKISKAFDPAPATGHARRILGEIGGSLDTVDAKETIACVIPNWSPFSAILWLCKSASSGGSSDYVFFQSDKQKWSMKPMEHLFSSNSSGITFFQAPADVRGSDGEYDEDYSVAITKFSFDHFDALANITTGYFASNTHTFDFISKKYEDEKNVFKYGDDCGADNRGKNFDLDIDPEACLFYSPLHPEIYDGGKKSYLDAVDEWMSSRASSIMKLDQEKIVFQIPGSIGATNWIGTSCNIDLPSHEDQTGDPLDSFRKGKYLIVAVAHILTKIDYNVNIEAIKKRLEKNV